MHVYVHTEGMVAVCFLNQSFLLRLRAQTVPDGFQRLSIVLVTLLPSTVGHLGNIQLLPIYNIKIQEILNFLK